MMSQTPHNPNDDGGGHSLGPDPSPNPRPHRAPPIHVARLDYERQERATSDAVFPTEGQFIIGVLTSLAYGAVAVVISAFVPFAGVLSIPAFVLVVIWIRRKTAWIGFVPGILTTVILIPVIGLIGFVLCGIILSNASFH